MMVPGLYSSVHNAVTYDYLTLQKKYSLNFKLNKKNWLKYIHEDIYNPSRNWSSSTIERQQKNLLEKFKSKNPINIDKDYSFTKTEVLKKIIKNLLPEKVLNLKRKLLLPSNVLEVKSIDNLISYLKYDEL